MAGNSVAKERWDAIESAWGLNQNGIFDKGEWIAQFDGEIQGTTSSTRLSLSSQQDAAVHEVLLHLLSTHLLLQRIERTYGGVKEFISGISFPPPALESRRSCPHCPMTFVNEQGLGIHVRTQHSIADMSNGVRLRRILRENLEGRVLPWEEAGPGRC
ncbi:unnamed protein product [Ectocarpus sp. CCAP 1310/34]|nr:unnamed protein product [Ectocarpus sp. CCAP 1310/34]